MLTAKPLDVLPHVRHGFFTREGGVSTGIYATLNCGYGSNDDPGAVRENRARVARALGSEPESLLTVYQVHSASVIRVTSLWEHGSAPQADAMVTDEPLIALGILTADCAPVLFADEKARVIGAAHAGWKGALTGVLEATVEAMSVLGAHRSRIVAAIGPCISRDAYEVGPEFRERFIEAARANERWFIPSSREGHFMFDLPAFVAARLEEAGVGAVATLGLCTYADEKRFFSYRRTTHRGESDYGRQISAIALRPDA
ncbi:MAG TPA: peptidoglycan editing factor PgeF [Parvibaculum sp.]|uniref:peptidoglycan editing factor PgeF n=1 Tax=Parvibaculum sp. TaxID=2024848 RepID=UPI002CCE44C0|nr:peptidoglycan editing factor PgeF [Parvibaculum sp.]HMM14554.1 peptidoglycan editing factor PgeF [Parvibaculum sp.]